MYTSATDERRSCLDQAIGNGAGAVFWAVFGAIYEYFSHSVYSYFMIYAFAPLMLSSLIYLCVYRFWKVPPKRMTRNLFTAFAATASVGMAAKGVVVIFGSTNRLLPIYLILASLMFILSAISYWRDRRSVPASAPEAALR